MSVKGQVAIVTGAGRGIGRAIAVALAKEGASVCLTARTATEIDAAAEEIAEQGGSGFAIPCDVSQFDQVQNMVRQTVERFGNVNILINNAGGHLERQTTSGSDPEKWRSVIESNVFGTYHCCRSVIEYMAEHGKIINVGSGMGHEARPGNSAYNTAKAAVWMLTRCLATEVWERGIDVNEFVPGPVYTQLTQDRFDPTNESKHPIVDSEWVKKPEDCVPLLMMMCKQAPGGPTGQSFSLARRPF